MKILPVQLQKIHLAKKQLGLKQFEYEALLSSFNKMHSNELTLEEADIVLNKFAEMGWTEKPVKKSNTRAGTFKIQKYGFGARKYENLRGRDVEYAEPSKLRMIEAMWRNISKNKTDESLQKFILRLTGKSDITFLLEKDANTVIAALNAMRYKIGH